MHDRYNTLASLLFEIEKELRTLQLWAVESLSAEALASEQPFAAQLSLQQLLPDLPAEHPVRTPIFLLLAETALASNH